VGALTLVESWPSHRWFFVLVPIALAGAALAARLGDEVEGHPDEGRPRGARGLGEARGVVTRLAGLFAVDSFAGGFVVQSFVAFWLARELDASTASIGGLFFAVGVLQTISFLAAPRIAHRFGLLRTMVGTHLPSNGMLLGVAFAPSFPVAAALLLGRALLGQMDVPTRQAYVMTLVEPAARVPAAAYTNTARYVVRPAGPALAGVAQGVALGAPFLVAGTVKIAYDLVLWAWFRRVPLHGREPA
jgi:predicted MFS family arabinose efflux permease